MAFTKFLWPLCGLLFLSIVPASYSFADTNGLLKDPSEVQSESLILNSPYHFAPENSKLLAQFGDGTDAYDPFADYNEFEESSDEEADINFLKHGRFLTLGFNAGYRLFTDVLGQLYQGSLNYGGSLSYFFNLRFAMQVSYITGDHPFLIGVNGTPYRGTVSIQQTSFDVKYYLSTQNVTRGLASFNPYVIVGFAQVYRTSRLDGTDGYARDGAIGIQAGAGFEIPMLRNKMYFGAEASYEHIGFADANNAINVRQSDGTVVNTGVYPRGDSVRLQGLLGFNF